MNDPSAVHVRYVDGFRLARDRTNNEAVVSEWMSKKPRGAHGTVQDAQGYILSLIHISEPTRPY